MKKISFKKKIFISGLTVVVISTAVTLPILLNKKNKNNDSNIQNTEGNVNTKLGVFESKKSKLNKLDYDPFMLPKNIDDIPISSWNPKVATRAKHFYYNPHFKLPNELTPKGVKSPFHSQSIQAFNENLNPVLSSSSAGDGVTQETWNWSPLRYKEWNLPRKNGSNKIDWSKYPAFNAKGDQAAYLGARGNSLMPMMTPDKFVDLDPSMNYGRATIPLKKTGFGERMNDTQGTLASFDLWLNMNTPFSPLGVAKGKDGTTFLNFTGFPFARSVFPWEGRAISGSFVDRAHRNGTLALSTIIMGDGGVEDRDWAALLSPGPLKDYPGAKGLAEKAQFYGFDGWAINDENYGPASDATSKKVFYQALNSYLKTDSYKTVDGKEIKLSEENSKSRKEFNYKFTPKVLSVYYHGQAAYYSDGALNHMFADTLLTNQKHVGDTHDLSSYWETTTKEFGRDRYFASSGINWPEDGMDSGLRKAMKSYYDGQKTDKVFDNNPSNRKSENEYSLWTWNIESNSNESEEKNWYSTTGDPRVQKQNSQEMSASDLYRAKTPILGNHDFATSFGYGQGTGLYLWGGQDIGKSWTDYNSTKGYQSYELASVLPQYQWVIDTYDYNGKMLNKFNDKYVSYNTTVKPFYDTEGEAFYGGSSLGYKGKLNPYYSIVNRLFSSNFTVQNKDKMVVVVKDNWKNKKEEIIPKLALWIADDKINSKDYLSDGTEIDPLDPNSKLGWSQKQSQDSDPLFIRAPQYKYKHDVIEEYKSNGGSIYQKYLSGEVKNLNNGWKKITYDISNLAGKSIISFGVKATGKSYPENIQKLKIGYMSYDAYSDENKDILIEKPEVDAIVTSDKKYNYARMHFQPRFINENNFNPEKVRNYIAFLKNDNGIRVGVLDISNNPYLYLKKLPKHSNNIYKIEIVAVGEKYDIIGSQDVLLDTSKEGNSNTSDQKSNHDSKSQKTKWIGGVSNLKDIQGIPISKHNVVQGINLSNLLLYKKAKYDNKKKIGEIFVNEIEQNIVNAISDIKMGKLKNVKINKDDKVIDVNLDKYYSSKTVRDNLEIWIDQLRSYFPSLLKMSKPGTKNIPKYEVDTKDLIATFPKKDHRFELPKNLPEVPIPGTQWIAASDDLYKDKNGNKIFARIGAFTYNGNKKSISVTFKLVDQDESIDKIYTTFKIEYKVGN